ncbi:hypothetical protein LshimejAT787_1205150 [Lyophyllum shimeji]|uniref:F-box domain-containing protein n=1 Tax=Lyophyllum shimeji TaxID=47721 RepID=A0A9P3PXN3_LYOSH|nr:hypothetical protein LshimejAT787_1205150 [Lyophyllum shimeji]
MHRCLKVAEILFLIFERLYDQPATLGALAETCTGFSETALNLLWRALSSLVPLIKVMPEDLWAVEPETSPRCMGLKVLIFTRQLEERDWERFRFYAGRIHRFGYYRPGIPFENGIHIHENVLTALTSYTPVCSLLPNLRALQAVLEGPHILKSPSFFPAILCPRLTEIKIRAMSLSKEMYTFLSSVACLCPNLRSLDIHTSEEDIVTSEFISAMEHLVCSLPDIRRLSVEFPEEALCTTSAMIDHLGSLPNLSICFISQVPPDKTMSELQSLFTTEGGRFPALSKFAYTAPTLALARAVIESLQCPLQQLAVDISASEEPIPALASFTSSFRYHRCSSSLTSFCLTGYSELDSVDSASMCAAFSSLFSLRALEHIYIGFFWVSHLDDTWYANAATAWPHLRALDFSYNDPPKVTLSGLIPLIRNCRRLDTLTLSIVAKPFDPEILQVGDRNLAITHLSLQDSEIESPVDVYRCLLQLASSLGLACELSSFVARRDYTSLYHLLCKLSHLSVTPL